MGTKLSNLRPPRGAKKNRKRLGRGPGSGQGTTAGKGQKGQKSRSGVTLGRAFEGGQMPLVRRLPKKGFKNLFRVEYAPVNLSAIAERFSAGEVVDVQALKGKGLAPRSAERVKVLGDGQLGVALTVRAHAFSRSAMEKIVAAGGTAEVVEMPQRKPIKEPTKRKAKRPAPPRQSTGETPEA